MADQSEYAVVKMPSAAYNGYEWVCLDCFIKHGIHGGQWYVTHHTTCTNTNFVQISGPIPIYTHHDYPLQNKVPVHRRNP